MVRTRSGKNTTMEMSDELKAYLDTRFEQLLQNLATKNDIIKLKGDVTSMLSKIDD